jgi:hypothetical protein
MYKKIQHFQKLTWKILFINGKIVPVDLILLNNPTTKNDKKTIGLFAFVFIISVVA